MTLLLILLNNINRFNITELNIFALILLKIEIYNDINQNLNKLIIILLKII